MIKRTPRSRKKAAHPDETPTAIAAPDTPLSPPSSSALVLAIILSGNCE
jgi:hypothetical protein